MFLNTFTHNTLYSCTDMSNTASTGYYTVGEQPNHKTYVRTLGREQKQIWI